MWRVKNINKYIEKNCASRWSFTKNHYMAHAQQNIKDRHCKYNVTLGRVRVTAVDVQKQ